MRNKLLIFDLDGTLADTLYTIRDAVNLCLRHFSLPERSYDEVKAAVGDGARLLLERSVPEDVLADSARFEEIFDFFGGCYVQTHDRVERCYDGLFDVVMTLRKQGHTLAVLSNKPDRLVGGIIKKLFPEGTFAFAMGQTEQPKKPDPTVPRAKCRELGFLPCDTYFIGDSDVDIKTAKNAGFGSAAVSWGFRDRELLAALNPDVICDTPRELLEFFQN